MKCLTVFSAALMLFYLIGLMPFTNTTCVIESFDNFILDCAFKKSGLFRVRNLGGAKAHFSFGLSLGDDFGFRTLLEELGGYKRRSLNTRMDRKAVDIRAAPQLPPRQIQQIRPTTLIAKPKPSVTMNNSPTRGMARSISLPLTIPEFKPLQREKVFIPAIQTYSTDQNAFRRNDFEIQKSISYEIKMDDPVKIYPVNQHGQPINRNVNNVYQMKPSGFVTPMKRNAIVPNFKASPIQSYQTILTKPIVNHKRIDETFQPDPIEKPPSDKVPLIDLKGHTIEELAAVANVSVNVMRAAIKTRQQQILAEQQKNAYQKFMVTSTVRTTTTTTTTTEKPKNRHKIFGNNKVMNAPKEYYPIGYLQNFDDNFTSKVDLPKTTFHCGDQKYFPGLYADEDLGCMVFHVCAVTDQGLTMKSFLCPESTLFDQTILKCNWWYYVDCKSSKNLYSSNIPVSKSYQLMKALTYFSNYKANGGKEEGVSVGKLKESINRNS